MSQLAWLVIADDLTGACDTGAVFARAGYETRVLLKPSAALPAVHLGAVWVIPTGSRHLPSAEAEQAVEWTMRSVLPVVQPAFLFHKIDSTLRGNPVVELRAVMRSYGAERAVVCPAFPQQGRTVRDGQVWVRGQRLEDTIFGKSATGGSLLELFQTCAPVSHLDLNQLRAGQTRVLANSGTIIADAETSEDLTLIAKAGIQAGVSVWCGAAGLARALAGDGSTDEPVPAGSLNWVVVAGSQNPVTRAQVNRLAEWGAKAVSPQDFATSMRIGNLSDSMDPIVITTSSLEYGDNEDPSVVAQLAKEFKAAIEQYPGKMPNLILTGGDTALAVCEALGCTQIRLVGELEPGIAIGQMEDGLALGLRVVTKAGGFGDENTLARIVFRRS